MAIIKKKMGRPKGSKNKDTRVKRSYNRRNFRDRGTVEKTDNDMPTLPEVKEERYYPKSWINVDASEDTTPIVKTSKRGRPKGTKTGLSVLNKAEDTKNGPGTPLFEKGNAPSSMGRPKGSRNKITVALEQMGEDNAKAVYAKLVDLALSGDVHACRLILDRVYPQRKGFRFSLEFDGPLDTLEQINALSKHVLGMVISGEVSPEEAEEYGKVLEQRMKIIADTDVAKKIQNACAMIDEMKRGILNAV